jgi:hypothetical protein
VRDPHLGFNLDVQRAAHRWRVTQANLALQSGGAKNAMGNMLTLLLRALWTEK